MAVYHFKNFEMLDPDAGELRGGRELVVEGDSLREVSDKPIRLAKADVIDCGGRTLMPGLIDSHVHVVLSEVMIRNLESVPLDADDGARGRSDAQACSIAASPACATPAAPIGA